MKALLIILGILVLLALIPLGAHVRYDADGPFVALVVGPIRIRLIPYFAWANRSPGEMRVWLRLG